MFDALGKAINGLVLMAVAGLILMPLGLWKLVEIVAWIFAR